MDPKSFLFKENLKIHNYWAESGKYLEIKFYDGKEVRSQN